MANISKYLKSLVDSLSSVATSGSYNSLSDKPTLGTAADKNVGTGANQVVQLDASSKIPSLDGSQVTNLDKNNMAGLAAVALSNSYNDLDDKPLVSVPKGAILPFAFNTVPTGFLECNGAEISRTTYDSLFTLIGNVFGVGDGSTTFNIPDLRGEFIRGWDNSRGVDSGRSFGSSQLDEFKSHKHGLANGYYGGNAPGIAFSNNNPATGTYDANTQIGILAEGDNETRPRNIALMYCIKY